MSAEHDILVALLNEILKQLRASDEDGKQFQWPEGGRRYVLGASCRTPLSAGCSDYLHARSELLHPVHVLGVIPVGDPDLLLCDIRFGNQSAFGNSHPVVFGSLEAIGGVYPIEGFELQPSQDVSIAVTNPTGNRSSVSASVLCWHPGELP